MRNLLLKSREVRKAESVRGVHDSASKEFTAITQEQVQDKNATQKWPKTSVGVKKNDLEANLYVMRQAKVLVLLRQNVTTTINRPGGPRFC